MKWWSNEDAKPGSLSRGVWWEDVFVLLVLFVLAPLLFGRKD